ncbi:putative membrane-anchored protein [Planomicrobium koreense]|uniref:Putative membrane-anchored protein n=1 Tax=Planococcus koreensis TaxID=112331 RepID=A0A7W8FS48_9BACL|nr:MULTISPECIES: hypothetical protein [Planococcus]MBB5178631.1 putative membrane-anchored protein [Planococcus koreensis]MDN3450933.1 hypothetical protein [Planococcus sp. APC 3906]
MRSKIGIVLDIFILVIGPWILYTRIIEIMERGVSVYPVISIIIISLAIAFSIYNLYLALSSRQQRNPKK